MKTLLTALIIAISFGSFAQTRIGTVSAFQIVEKEVRQGDMVLYYPREPVRVEGSLWLTLELDDQRSLSTFMELTDDNRKKIIEILEAYNKLKNVVETPQKLPGSYNIGQVTVRAAFSDNNQYHLAPAQNILFYVKFDKNGNKTLAMAIGKMTSKTHPNITHTVPLLWFNDVMVYDFASEISDGNVASFMRHKGKTIDAGALELMGK